MIAVIFGLTPAEGRTQDYLGLAAGLKAEVESHEGFISIERGQAPEDSCKDHR